MTCIEIKSVEFRESYKGFSWHRMYRMFSLCVIFTA